MRKLASVKIIKRLTPIEGKDRIELAEVDGWKVIVKKGEFKPGGKCVYVEIDSVLPEKPEFEFLRKSNFRIKTMKMAGTVSQGICFPMSVLPEKEYKEGDDVTDILGIKQYERTMDKGEPGNNKKPSPLMRVPVLRKILSRKKAVRTEFPNFVSKTDEIRIQNIPGILNENGIKWIATEKIDGQSGTFCLTRHKSKIPFMRDKFEYMVCSRNYRLAKKDSSSYWQVSDKYHVEEALKKLIGKREWVVIQGECVAPNVQGNKYNVKEADLYVFNLIYPDEGRICSTIAEHLCEEVGLKFVPIIAENMTLPETVDEVLEFAHGKSKIGDTLREGVVFRSTDGKRSFKAVDPLFLLKYDE